MRRAKTTVLASCVSLFAAAGAFACPPSGTACPCDWNNDGLLDCTDLNAYLVDYFNADMCADFNLSGTIPTVQDLFDYLECLSQSPGWLAGLGSGLPCGAGALLAPAANGIRIVTESNCAMPGSLELTPGIPEIYNFETRPCATTDGPAETDCFGSGAGQVHNDSWFVFSATASGVLTIDTCFVQTVPSTRLAAYLGASCPTAGSGRLVSCSDSLPANCPLGKAKLTVNVVQGNDYIIRVGDDGTTHGPGRLRAQFDAVAQRCAPAGAGTTTATYSIVGNGNGGHWSWSVQTASAVISGVENVGVVGTAAQVAARFVTDINSVISAAGCGGTMSATDLGGGNFSIQVAGSAWISLWVGPNPGTPTCLVHNPLSIAGPPCQFNPSVIQLSGSDCNHNGRDDALDILLGSSHDLDHDGVLDECNCAGDFNNNGVKSTQDLFDFLAAYFGHDASGDFNHDGAFSVQDIFDFLGAFFTPCL